MRFVDLRLTSAVCAFATCCFFGTPTAGAQQSPAAGKAFVITNVNSRKPLVIEKGSKDAGAKVIQDSSPKLHVAWKLEKVGGEFFRIVNAHNGLVLSVTPNKKESEQVVQAKADNGDHQAWKFVQVEKAEKHYWIINKSTGLVLDISQDSTSNGASLIQFPQKNAKTKNQHWILKGAKK